MDVAQVVRELVILHAKVHAVLHVTQHVSITVNNNYAMRERCKSKETVSLATHLLKYYVDSIQFGNMRNDYNEGWRIGLSKTITFIVTKDCQLACKYCYLIRKNSKEIMSWDVAIRSVNYILDHEDDFPEESVVFDFIGGEPFLEIGLIDKVCDYLKKEMFKRNHHWFNSYRFSFSTNGINYDNELIQRFIVKNKSHVSIGITIDGTARKHDMNRIYKGSGRGSYKDVVRNIPLWLTQIEGASTKVTISSADIPYIKESVLHLYSLGIHEVNINCVFEKV